MADDAKGKPCPYCGEPLSDLGSQFVRMCTNGKCKAEWPWPLDDGQPPLVTSSRDKDVPGTA
ncbi:hypothetical protein D3C76_915920 [compost metagenome]